MSVFSRELFSFVEIARERSIRKAAEKLNISSSALSRQMRLLEQDLGARLLIRTVKGIRLTEHGQVTLKQAEEWLADSNHLRARLRSKEAGPDRILRIGAMECFSASLIPTLFRRLNAVGLANRIEVKVAGTDVLVRDLREDRLDLIVAFNAHQSHDIRVISETVCRIGMIYSPELCEVGQSEVSISSCLDWPICLPDKNLSLHHRLLAEILKQRKDANIIATSNSVEFIREMVVRGEAISFLTWFDIRDAASSRAARYVPLSDKRLTEIVSICVSGTAALTEPLALIARQAEDVIGELSGSV